MMTFTFKTCAGDKFDIRACDLEQARVLAMVKFGTQGYRADLVKMTNAI